MGNDDRNLITDGGNKMAELEAALADTRLVLGKKVVQLEQTLSMLDKLQKQNIELISKLEDAK